jgi:hypothetical protein
VFKVIFFSLGFAEKKKQWRIQEERHLRFRPMRAMPTTILPSLLPSLLPKRSGRKSSLSLSLRNALVRGPDPDPELVRAPDLKNRKSLKALKTGVLPPLRRRRKIPHRKMKMKLSLAKTYSGNGSAGLTLSSAKAPALALTLSIPKPSAPSFAPPEKVQSFAEGSSAERMQTPLA